MKKYIIVIIALLYSFLGVNMLFAAVNIWTQKADFGGTARGGAIGFSIGSKGYIGTGYDLSYKKDFWEYDPAADAWTQKADFGGAGRTFAVGFSIGSKGYIGTGYDGSYKKDFWEYDPAANTWTQKADFGETARSGAVGFSVGSKGYIGTGGSYKKDFWEYDPAANTWTRKADFGGTARDSAVGFSIGSKGYIGTGRDGSYSYTKDFWEYDPAADTWTQRADFGGTARMYAVGFSFWSKGYIGMGWNSLESRTKDFMEYDPTVDAWIQKADFGGTARTRPVGFSIGSKGYIGTGSDDSSEKDFWEYDSSTVPGAATLISPSGAISTTTPTYIWNAVSNASWYQLWNGTAATWYSASAAGCGSGTGTCSITGSSLPAGSYTWYVQTYNSSGLGPWSSGMGFTISGGGVPSAATLISPSGAITTTTPTYIWNAVSNASYYQLWNGTAATWYTASAAGCGSGTGTCSITGSALTPGSYTWYVQTYNSSGLGPWSSGMGFTISGGGVPSAATLISPSGAITTTTPTYIWNAVSNASYYQLWNGTAATWYTASAAGCGTGTGTGTCSVAGSALTPGSYTWYVQTYNSSGLGPWSSGMGFTVDDPSVTAPLPPWLTYCDTEPCTSIAPVVVYVCPTGSPQCTPARSTTIMPQVDGKPISGVFFPIVAPDDTSLRLVSGNGHVSLFYVTVFQASKVILGSTQDIRVSFYDVAPVWGGMTPLNFTSTNSTSALLDTTFYYHPSYDTGTAATDLHAQGKAVIMTERAMTGRTSGHVTAFFMPTELAGASGGEGNFSYGNGTVTINYGNPPYIVAKGGIMNTALPRFAHEYAHELFDEIETAFSGNDSCLNEGIADALAYTAGFLPEDEFGPVGMTGIDFNSGCTALSEIHDVGNCYFWHVKKAGLLTSSFLYGIFHPQHTLSFNSCAQNTIETGNSILVYFTESADGANMVPVLESMKIPHAGSYDAAKLALGL